MELAAPNTMQHRYSDQHISTISIQGSPPPIEKNWGKTSVQSGQGVMAGLDNTVTNWDRLEGEESQGKHEKR